MRKLLIAFIPAIIVLSQSVTGGAPNPSRPTEGTPGGGSPLPSVDIISWDLLMGAGHAGQATRGASKFRAEARALDGQTIKLRGFMIPLQATGDRQKQFLLSASPRTCAFCLPGGPDSLVLVDAKRPIAFTYDPQTVEGQLHLLPDDATGLWYRLNDAQIAER